jgi:uncharacterized protein YndB with AHSA1/START domain
MARNEIHVAAPPRAVYEVLSDPRAYAEWVVGSREIRAADRGWPAPGTALDHSVGLPPLVIKDHTAVLSARAPVMLELRARARPFPTARITLHLQPEADGTRVTLIEDPANLLLNLLAGPLGHAAIRLRNRESLRRLKAIAEGRARRPGGELPPRDGTSASAV